MLVFTNINKICFVSLSCRRNKAPPKLFASMKKVTEYRMIVLADNNTGAYPMVDLAQQVNGQWLSVETAKTAEQLNEESATNLILSLAATGIATCHEPVKLVSYAHGLHLCRAYEKEAARRAAALPASYHAARARRFSRAY
jgi:hypothetical protein